MCSTGCHGNCSVAISLSIWWEGGNTKRNKEGENERAREGRRAGGEWKRQRGRMRHRLFVYTDWLSFVSGDSWVIIFTVCWVKPNQYWIFQCIHREKERKGREKAMRRRVEEEKMAKERKTDPVRQLDHTPPDSHVPVDLSLATDPQNVYTASRFSHVSQVFRRRQIRGDLHLVALSHRRS